MYCRIFLIALLTSVSAWCAAPAACGPASEIQAALQKAAVAAKDPADFDHKIAPFVALRQRYPNDLFVHEGLLDTTHAAMTLSAYTNAVSKKHAEVARGMFPGWAIDSITNGVHPGTWVSAPVAALLDKAAPGWRGGRTRQEPCPPARQVPLARGVAALAASAAV